MKLKIVYEDESIIVVDKPSGLLTMSTGKSDETTAYRILTEHVRNCRRTERDQRIFIVHRLDRDTSGLLLFAKDFDTKRLLQDNWNESVLKREYTAILEGDIEDEEGWIETWMYENPKSMKVHCYPISKRDLSDARMGKCRYAEQKGWQYASSHCHTISRKEIEGKAYTMVQFKLETGRKNQIRVHSAWIGHPIAGDKKYGALTNPFGRLALHATGLSFIHPHSGKVMNFNSPLPKALKGI